MSCTPIFFGACSYRDRRSPFLALILLLVVALFVPSTVSARSQATPSDLEENFRSPPDAARPWVYWFWMNGNLTKEGITADLEAMKRVGIGGTLIMSVSTGILPGKVDFMSPKWRELFTHAVREADRLGLKIIMNNDDGWTGSGGPWNPVENSMQMLTSRETRVKGPAKLDQVLPRPYAKMDYYRDIALLAMPLQAGDGPDFRALGPKVTSSDPHCKTAPLIDNDTATDGRLPASTPDKPQWIQLAFDKPFTAESLVVWCALGPKRHEAELQVSDDGKKFRKVARLRIFQRTYMPDPAVFNFKPVNARFFRIAFLSSNDRWGGPRIAEIELFGDRRVENWPAQTAAYRADRIEPFIYDQADTKPQPMTHKAPLWDGSREIIDLTSKLDADGRLKWDVPKGEWILLRLGHTTNGKQNHPCSPQGVGLECDKLSKEAMATHFEGLLAKLIADIGPLAGKTLIATHIDSWEVGSQNWTPKLREEFKARRGYDPSPYLPTLAGHLVGNREISDRFLWDYRKTLSEMMADNYFGHLRTLAKKHGMGLSVEAYGAGNFTNLQCAARSDIPMAEFWVDWPEWRKWAKEPASAGHTAGHQVIAAESFTATQGCGKWRNHPYKLKALGDLMYTLGINRFVFHRYAMQPWMDRLPGMTFGGWGTNIERTCTWFEPGRAWFRYLARCQYLLQKGNFVADLCYFVGQSAPNRLEPREKLRPALPAGYDYDGCHDEIIFERMSVKDGRIVLPDGISYRVLVLPPSRFMTPELLRKIGELVRAGAQVVGPKPDRSPSLVNYPECDAEVRRLADELWGDTSTPGEKATGKGKVYWGKSLEDVLAELDVPPDVEFSSHPCPWIHRRIFEGGTGVSPVSNAPSTGKMPVPPEADVYFVSNQADAPRDVEAVFRVGGKLPELWHADTGETEPAGLWRATDDGRTAVQFRLEPRGSVFVVFRNPAGQVDPVVSITLDGQPLVGGPVSTPRIAIHKAVYGVPGDAKRTIDVTKKVTSLVAAGQHRVHVWSTLGGDPAYGTVKTLTVDYSLGNEKRTASAVDGQMLDLHVGAASPRPAAQIKSPGGVLSLVASKPGVYTLKTASGKTIKRSVADVPKPITLAGPWELDFPKGWDTPESITLDRLISWPQHDNEGVKHFSGTATYRKKFNLPAERLAKGEQLFLDLGRVAVMAEVKLNGKDLGILWKPPFRVDVTDVVKPGTNELEIRVTNLWPNRLIGDERKKPYLKWNSNGGPAEWPDWVADGSAVPKTGRLTFTTWHQYDKDHPLLESGLLGPVQLDTLKVVPIMPENE
ncbi:MAG: discoidin domain-containing protein [Pirellulales bacterium]|nr:discoidin domain-containing protein [Pirellulales bacterium]